MSSCSISHETSWNVAVPIFVVWLCIQRQIGTDELIESLSVSVGLRMIRNGVNL